MRRKSTTSEMMKQYIVEALFRLMKKKPFAEITIGEITKTAGVNRSIYYQHFESKEDILFYFLDGVMREYVAGIRKELGRKQYFEKMFLYFAGYRTELLLFYDNGLPTLFLLVLNRYFGEAVNRDLSKVAQYTAAYHVGGVFNCFLLWFSHRMADSPEEMAGIVMSIIPPDFEPMLNRLPC